MRRRTAVLIAVALALLAGVAFARPGGGDSYSGGGGRGGGGGSDVGFIFELIYWTLRLIIYYPHIGLPILGCIIGWIAYSAYKQHANKDWDSGPPAVHHRVDLSGIRSLDPDFSPVVFEDFA